MASQGRCLSIQIFHHFLVAVTTLMNSSIFAGNVFVSKCQTNDSLVVLGMRNYGDGHY